jgi:hypothetical protein
VLFEVAKPTAAKWSLPAASGVNPEAISPGHILVSAPAGQQILSAVDGSTTATLPSSVEITSGVPVIDGLLIAGNDLVLELDPPSGG